MALDPRQLNVDLPAIRSLELPEYRPSRQATPPKPEVDSVQKLSAHLKQAWQPRTDRLQILENLYRLKHPKANAGEHVTAMPDPKLMVNKVAARLGTAGIEEQVIASSEIEVTEEAAQREETFDGWWLEQVSDQLEEEGHGRLQPEAAFHSAHRGAMANIVLADPTNPKFPWKFYPLDWANVYPSLSFGADRPILCINQMNADELIRLFPGNKRVKEMGISETQEVTYYYDSTWMGIIMGDGTVLKPFVAHQYGWNPCVLSLVGGWPVRTTPWENSTTFFVEYAGMPLMDPLIEWVEEFDKILSEAYSHHARAFAPPLAVFWDKENHQVRTVEIDTSPNAVNNMPVGVEDVKIWNPGALVQETQFLSSVFQSRLNRLLPAITFGEFETNESGYAGQIARAAANDAFFPSASAIQSHIRRILYRVKSLMANDDVGLSPVMVASQRRATPYTPEDAKLETNKIIKLADTTPQDLAVLRSQAIQAMQVGLLAISEAQELGRFTTNPRASLNKMLKEKIYLSPEVLKVEIAKVLANAQAYEKLMAFTTYTPPPQPAGQAPPPNPLQPGSQAVPPEALGQGEEAMAMLNAQEPMPQLGSGGRGPY